MSIHSAYIFDAIRTPRTKGKPGGELSALRPVELMKIVLCSLRERNHLETEFLDDVILGCVTPVGEQGGNIAKAAAQYANYHEKVAGVTLNRFCSSGLEAINQAAAGIMSGMQELVVAGGIESMSRVPMGSDSGAWMRDPDVMKRSHFIPQGVAADLIATLKGYTREDVDSFAVRSQARALKAQREGHFKSITPVGDVVLDSHLRAGVDLESLGKLKPAFKELGEQGYDEIAQGRFPSIKGVEHVHHAGNSSGIVDGASAVLLGTKEMGERLGLKARARIRSFAVTSTNSTLMLTGPAPATLKALKKAGMNLGDIDLIEINEAFASVVLNYLDELQLDIDKVNVNGGAIALGHPLGATGAILVGTILDEMERRNLATGLVTLCVGGGMGVATILERV